MDRFYRLGCLRAKLAFGLDSREGMDAGAPASPSTNTDDNEDPLPQGYRPTHTMATPRADSDAASNVAFDRHDTVSRPELRGRSTPSTEYVG